MTNAVQPQKNTLVTASDFSFIVFVPACVALTMKWLTAHGVDFAALGYDADTVKNNLTAYATTAALAFKPSLIWEWIKEMPSHAKCCVDMIVSAIFFIRASYRKLKDAIFTPNVPPLE